MNIEKLRESNDYASRAKYLLDDAYREGFNGLTPLEARTVRGIGRRMGMEIAELRLLIEHLVPPIVEQEVTEDGDTKEEA
jgi:hypothetical protein